MALFLGFDSFYAHYTKSADQNQKIRDQILGQIYIIKIANIFLKRKLRKNSFQVNIFLTLTASLRPLNVKLDINTLNEIPH